MLLRNFFGMLAATIGLLGAAATQAGDADFTLVNGTGYDIREVYIFPTNRESWGRDRLGDGTLDKNKSRLFRFSDNANCRQDIKVVFDDNNSEVIWKNFDLCALDKITLRYNRATKTVTAVTE